MRAAVLSMLLIAFSAAPAWAGEWRELTPAEAQIDLSGFPTPPTKLLRKADERTGLLEDQVHFSEPGSRGVLAMARRLNGEMRTFSADDARILLDPDTMREHVRDTTRGLIEVVGAPVRLRNAHGEYLVADAIMPNAKIACVAFAQPVVFDPFSLSSSDPVPDMLVRGALCGAPDMILDLKARFSTLRFFRR